MERPSDDEQRQRRQARLAEIKARFEAHEATKVSFEIAVSHDLASSVCEAATVAGVAPDNILVHAVETMFSQECELVLEDTRGARYMTPPPDRSAILSGRVTPRFLDRTTELAKEFDTDVASIAHAGLIRFLITTAPSIDLKKQPMTAQDRLQAMSRKRASERQRRPQ